MRTANKNIKNEGASASKIVREKGGGAEEINNICKSSAALTKVADESGDAALMKSIG